MKVLNSKLVIMLQYQNIKIFLQKAIFQIDLKKLWWLKKLKILYRGLSDLNGEKIAGKFYEKELQKTNQKEFRFKKVIKSKKKW